MRFICLILAMVMVSTPSQSKQKYDYQDCSVMKGVISGYLHAHSNAIYEARLADPTYMEGLARLDEVIEDTLDKATKYATIYNAMCK